MSVLRSGRFVLPWLAACLIAIVDAAHPAPASATDISWNTTSKITSSQGDHYAYEGTATFTDGEEAHVVGKGIRGENASASAGTSTVEATYQFKDGSGFTLRFLSIWNATASRNGGIFMDGTGRFAGMIGATTAAAQRPASGPTTTVWTGSYDLLPR